MSQRNGTHIASGIVAGIAGGLVASWVMNQFMAGVGPKLQEAVQGKQASSNRGQSEETQEPKDDATMKAADAIVSTVTGGQHLSHEGREKGGPVVHYAFGAIMGALYGALAEGLPAIRAGFGTAFGSALFTGADLFAVPALHLSEASDKQPVSALATPFAAHIVYGMTTEAVRRLVRAVL